MDLKFANISDNPSHEELKTEINRLKVLKADYKNDDSALKIILNSVYGVVGFPAFICYDIEIARSITGVAHELMQYTIAIFNEYFQNDWNDKPEIQKEMGITKSGKISNEVVLYADTDSVFLFLEEVMSKSDFKGTHVDFILKLLDVDLDEYVRRKMSEYITKYNGYQERPNGGESFVLEMEQIAYSILWVAKKMYIKNLSFVEGVYFDPETNIQVKGLDMNKSSTPRFVRDKLSEIVMFIISKGKNVSIDDIISKLIVVREEFKTRPPDDLCKLERISGYDKYVVSDTEKLEFVKGAKDHIKGAAFCNYLIKKHNLLEKYDLLHAGEKVYKYYTKNNAIETFSYRPNDFPGDIAPPIDRMIQFEKVMLAPLNRILNAIGVKPLNSSLIIRSVLKW